MKKPRPWLNTESVFYYLAIGIIVHSVGTKGEVTQVALNSALALAAFGKSMPTELVDKTVNKLPEIIAPVEDEIPENSDIQTEEKES